MTIKNEAHVATKDSMILGCIEHAERELADAQKCLEIAEVERVCQYEEGVRRYHSGRIHALRDVLVGLRNLATYVDSAPQADPLLGFSPSEIVIGAGGQTLADVANESSDAQDLNPHQVPDEYTEVACLLGFVARLAKRCNHERLLQLCEAAQWGSPAAHAQIPVMALQLILTEQVERRDTQELQETKAKLELAEATISTLREALESDEPVPELLPGWEDRAVERAKREGVIKT